MLWVDVECVPTREYPAPPASATTGELLVHATKFNEKHDRCVVHARSLANKVRAVQASAPETE